MNKKNRIVWKRSGSNPLTRSHDMKEMILIFLAISGIFSLLLFSSFSHQGEISFVVSKTTTTLTGAVIGTPLLEALPDNSSNIPSQIYDEPTNQTVSDPQSEPQQPTQPDSLQEVIPAEEPSPSEQPILGESPIPLGASLQGEQVLPSSDNTKNQSSLSSQSSGGGEVTAQANCAAWPCSCGDIITASITLTSNLTCSSLFALTVATSNLVIDGGGYYLIGTVEGNGTGILVNNSENVTIKNFAGLDNFSKNVYGENMTLSNIVNNNITTINNSAGSAGVFFSLNSSHNFITNNVIQTGENSKGIQFVNSNLNNSIVNNNITADSPGSQNILLANSNNNNTNISNNFITIFIGPSALDIQSGYNYISNNTMISNGASTLLNFENSGGYNMVDSNNFTLNAAGNNYIDSAVHAILSQTSGNNISRNTITASAQYAQGITLFNGMINIIDHNYFFISGQDSFAIGFIDGASNNTISSNNITVTGSGASHTIYEDFIGLDGLLGLNFIENNNLSSLLNYTIYDGEPAETSLIYNNSYGFFNITKSNITSNVSLVVGENVLLSYNNVGLLSNIQNLELNSSAQLELKSLEWINVSELLLDGTRCDNTDLCNISYDYSSGILTADVSYLGNFSTTSNNNQPSVDSIYLNASDFPNNLTTANLTLNLSFSDADGNPVKNISNWLVEGNSLTLLNMPFEGINKTTTGNAWDYSGFENHGLVTAAIWNATGGFDGKGAYEFTNALNAISLNFSFAVSDFTLTLFAKYHNYSNGDVFSVGDKNGLSLGFSSGGEPYFSAQNISFANITKYNNSIPPNSNTTSYNGQIPLGEAGSGDTSTVGYPAVIKDGNTYKMWYSGYPYIFYATSPDGLTWTKYNNSAPPDSDTVSYHGQIPQGTAPLGGDLQIAQLPAVIKDGETYKMWYVGNNVSGVTHIFYATSPDGLTWTKYNNSIPPNSDDVSYNGQIPQGTTGKGDAGYVYGLSVIKDGNLYKMWYSGFDGVASSRIYYATSSDGLIWTKYNNTIPPNSDTISYNGQIPLGTNSLHGDYKSSFYPNVIKDGDSFKMWYTGYDNNNYRIFYATSPDGLTWTKQNNSIPQNSNNVSYHGQIPLGSDGQGDDSRTQSVSVVKDGNTYKMWYTGYDGIGGFRIYYATLDSGLNFSTQAENSWTTISLSKRANASKFYVNGIERSSANFSTIILNGTIHLGDSFNGSIDEVQIYNRSLSAEQILALYNNQTNLIVSNETTSGETWSACVTPNDGLEDGIKTCSNNVTILYTISYPTVNLNFPQGNYWDNTGSINFNCSANSVDLANITLWTNSNGIWHANQTNATALGGDNSTIFTLTNLNDNNTGYLWNCLAYDTSGGSSFSTANRTFYIDTISPISNITISPTKVYFGITNISIDWNAFDLNESYVNANVTYPNGSLLAQSSDDTIDFLLNTTNLTATGSYRVIVWINDSAGNFNYSNTTFTVTDNLAPEVTLNYPPDNYWNNTANIIFNCSATNLNLSNITLWTDTNGSWSANQTKTLLGSDNSTLFNLTSLNDNNTGYLWNCLAYDSSGNSNFSVANRTFYIDSSAPNVNLISPSVDYVNNSLSLLYVNFTCNASDSNQLSNLSLYLTDSTNQSFLANQTVFINGTFNESNWTIPLRSGNYTWDCYACDVAGSCNFSSNNRTINLNATVAQLGVPLTGTVTLVENLTDFGDGLIIGANNTVIEGAGFNVVSNGSGSGINISSFSNVIIQNVVVDNFSVGLDLNNTQNVTISNITIVSANLSGSVGISLGSGSNGNNLTNLNISVSGNNSIGLYLNNSANNTLTSLSLSSAAGPELVLSNTSQNNSFTNVTLDNGPKFTSSLIYSLSVDVNTTPPTDPSGQTSLSYYLTLDNLSSDSHVDFNLSYLDSDLSGLTESTVRVYHYNDTSGEWSVLADSYLDADNNIVVSGFVNSFSTFGVFGDTFSGGSETPSGGGGGGSTISYPPVETAPLVRPEVPINSPISAPITEEATPELPLTEVEETPLSQLIKSEALVAQAIASDLLQLAKGLGSLVWIVLLVLVIGMLLLLIHLKRKGHSAIIFQHTAQKKLLDRQNMSPPERLASEMRNINSKLNYLNQSSEPGKENVLSGKSSIENSELARIEKELARLR